MLCAALLFIAGLSMMVFRKRSVVDPEKGLAENRWVCVGITISRAIRSLREFSSVRFEYLSAGQGPPALQLVLVHHSGGEPFVANTYVVIGGGPTPIAVEEARDLARITGLPLEEKIASQS